MGRNRGRQEPPSGVGGLPVADVTDSVGPGDYIALLRSAEGAAFVRPAREPVALGRLSRVQRGLVDALEHHGNSIALMQDHMRALVDEARDAGISWNVIGWSLGLTGEGARRAYGRFIGED